MRPILLLVIFTAFARPDFARQSKPENNRPAPRPEKPADGGADAAKRKQAATVRRDFANRALAFKEPLIKAYTLADLAALSWKDDPAFARQLFLRAYDALPSAEQAGAKDRPDAGESRVAEVAAARTEIVSRLANFDPALAKQLIDNSAGAPGAVAPESARADLRSANKLVAENNVPEAMTFARRSMQGGVPERLFVVLLALRQKDGAAANRLYMEALSQLASQPVVDGRVLLSMGLYVFTAPGIDPLDPEMAGAVEELFVGEMSVFDMSSARPNVQRSITRAYLNTAISAIGRSLADPAQRPMYYVVARQLLPHTQIFLPERAAELTAIIQTLTQGVPPSTVRDTAAAFAPRKEFGYDEELKNLDGVSDAGRRDGQALALVYELYNRKEFPKASAVNAKVKDAELRSALTNTIAFGEASQALESGDVARAVELINSLAPTGVERALLRIGVAHYYAERKDKTQHTPALNAALEDARRVSDERKPLLLVSLAGEFARTDPAFALQLFAESVRAFNALGEGDAASSFEWLDSNYKSVASKDGLYRYFPLEVKGVNSRLSDAIRQLAAADSDGTAAALLGLTHEKVLGREMVALARTLPM